jgi:methylated-DNA-[protein]-cysteine S-methyltransferase
MKRSMTLRSRPCRADDRFVAYITGDLPRTEKSELDRHTRQCPECRLRLSAFRSAKSRLDRIFSKSPRRHELAPAEQLLGALLAQIPEKRIYYDTVSLSGFGTVLLAATDRGLCFLSFRPHAENDYVKRWNEADFTVRRSGTALSEPIRELREYFSGKRKRFDVPTDLVFASDFTKEVLAQTARIKFGQVRTYQDVALAMGKPKSVRAVGNALGRNPIPIVVPCHRVVATGGGLGGFTGGISYKRKLLAIEGNEPDGGDLFG